MAQDYSGQLDKSNKAITAHKLCSHNLECWQINLHRCKAASYNMCEVMKNVRSGLVLAQEPWTYATKIRSKLRGWNLFQGIEKGNRPRACIYATPDLSCSLIPMFSDEDIVAVRVNNVCRKGDSFVFISAYMAAEQPAPPTLLRDLLIFTENEQIPTIVGTDANAHHTIWGSSDINPRGEDLLAFCVSADLNFCNVGNRPTYRNKIREEVLDLTLVNRCAWDRVVGWHVSNVPSFSDHMYIRFQVKSRIQKQAKMFRNVRRTCWNKYVNKLEQKLNERILPPVPVPSSIEDIDVLVNKVHSVVTKSYEAACPMRKSLRKKDNIWWNSELASLRKEARRAWKKAIKTKQENDWVAQKLAQSNLKKTVRRAKRDSWRSFVESTSSLTATARLVKIIRNNETVRVSNVIKHDGEFTKSPLETMNYLLDILSPGSQQTENHTTRSDLVDNPFVRPEDTEMIASICSLERMEAAITEFQPFKAPGPDEIYPVLLQKGWNQLKEYYHVIFQACLRHSYVPLAWKEGTGIFLPKPGKESYFEAKSFRMITLTSFQLKWLERLILYHINDDKNVQAKLSASQYGFRAGVSTETALHEFVRRVEQCLVRKKPALGIFLDIIGAFDNVTFRGFATALRGLGMSEILTSWIENLLRHCTVQVELYGDKVKREVMKGNPQGGILSPFLWNCVLNNLLLELCSRGFYVQAYADDLAILVTGADMLWIRGMAQKAINIAANWASEQELQFSSKKTEIVLFTHKRNPDLGSLTINGSKLKLSKEAKLLGVTLDSKLTWKPHITRITRRATTALMQCRQIVGKTWGIKPSIMKWIYTAVIRPIMSYACVSWAGGLNKKYLVRKLTKVQRLACLMISSAFPGTPTGALEILLNITPIEEFLLAEAVRGSYRISVSGYWHAKPVGSFGKTKSHVDICNEARRFLLCCKCQLTE